MFTVAKSPLSITELFYEYLSNPSLFLRNILVEKNAGLVRHIAHQYKLKCSEPYEDLEQIGYLGLIRAIEKFSPRQGCAFSSFAVPYIRGEILHHLRDKANSMRIPRRWQELYSKGKKIRKDLELSLQKTPKEEEIATALKISLAEWYECQIAQTSKLMLSLDSNLKNHIDGHMPLYETLVDYHSGILENQVEETHQLYTSMSLLEKKFRIAIEYVFLKEVSRKEAANSMRISPMTVTRHLNKGIENLSRLMRI